MAKPKLTNEDYCRASKRLKCEVAAIKAVASVESAGNGFYDDGFPVILFERHLFRKFTQGRYNSTYPEISGAQGGYGGVGPNQRRKFSLAFSLNPDAAMKSCSWGKFQILGSNYQVCGYNSAGAFVDAMKESEGKQLDAFVAFVIGNSLDDNLRGKDWAGFARGYNGPAYKTNKYDSKMASAYTRFKGENIDCSKLSAAGETSNGHSTENTEGKSDNPANMPLDSPPPSDPPQAKGQQLPPTNLTESSLPVAQITAEQVEDKKPGGIRGSIAAACAFVASAGSGFVGMFAGLAPIFIVSFFGCAAIIGVTFTLKKMSNDDKQKARDDAAREKREERAHQLQVLMLEAAANKDKNAVHIVPPPTEMPSSVVPGAQEA